jgi:hypothetical protein
MVKLVESTQLKLTDLLISLARAIPAKLIISLSLSSVSQISTHSPA